MKKMNKVIVLVCAVMLLPACAGKYKKAEQDVKKPINCANAEGDIRVLENEKAHVAEQIADGVSAIHPASLVLNLITKTEGEKIKVATGKYDKMIDEKIAEIKQTCGIK